MKLTVFLPVFLLSILYSTTSFSAKDNSNFEKVDPDSIDPKMTSVIYHISPKDLSIASYRQGKPSHLSVLLCRQCKIKTYSLSTEAQLIRNQESISNNNLALIIMKKEYNYVTVSINRNTQSIDYLVLDDVKKSEF
jgi:hypothetical protein